MYVMCQFLLQLTISQYTMQAMATLYMTWVNLLSVNIYQYDHSA